VGLFDDIPNAAPKAGPSGSGLFDDLPDAQKPEKTIAPDAGRDLLQGHITNEAALQQRTLPGVRSFGGQYIRKPLGEVDEGAEYPVYKDAAGQERVINPKTDVMLRDPQTGKLMAFARSPETDISDAEAAGRKLLEGFMVGPVSRLASSGEIPMAVQRGRSLGFGVSPKTEQLGDRARDAAAFAELDAPIFAPAFRSKGAARVARTVEEMPIIGGIVKGPKTETETALANTQARIASDLGAAPTDEAAGRVLQQGLDRFKTAGIKQIEPGVLAARGIEPREAIQPQPFMSGPALTRAEEAAPIREQLGGGVAQTSRGVEVPAARPLDQTLIARRGAESLSNAELETLIRTPARETSFAARQEALFEKAWRSIPERFRIDESRNPERLAAVNTRAALSGIDAEIASQIAGQRTISGPLADRLRKARAHFDMNDLRAMRTEVGRALSSADPNQTRLNATQLRQLYGALSRDIEVGLQDIANRAYIMTRAGGNRPDRIAAEAAQRADQALRDFRVADRYTRLGMDRMNGFARVMNAQSPEAAVRALSTRIREATIDRGTVRAVADALRPEEREQVLGYLVSNMGKTRPGGKEAEIVWNIHTFATDWNKNKTALALLSKGTDPAIIRKLDALASVSERMKYYETTKNYSGSAYAGIPFLSGIASLVSGGAWGIASLLAQIGGSAAIAKFLTTPKYLDWMVTAAKTGAVPRAGGPQVGGTNVPTMLSNLEKLAANDNQLGPIIRQAIAKLQSGETDPSTIEPSQNPKSGRPINVKQ
jgi:hypothetical protein